MVALNSSGASMIADVTDTGQPDQGRAPNALVQMIGDGHRRPDVVGAVDQERRNIDGRQRRPQVLGRCTRHRPEAGGVKREHRRATTHRRPRGDTRAANIVGSNVSTNSSGDSSDSSSAWRRRRSAVSGGSEPAHPA